MILLLPNESLKKYPHYNATQKLASSRARKNFCWIHLFIGQITHCSILSPTIAFM